MTEHLEQDLKWLKEQFVSNLEGGSQWEVISVSLTVVSSYIAWASIRKNTQFLNNWESLSAIWIDYILNWFVVVAAFTFLSSHQLFLHVGLWSIAVGVYMMSGSSRSSSRKIAARPPVKRRRSSASSTRHSTRQHRPFLTIYRSHMMIMTSVAILAVDFHAFPRRFAKVEDWGTSIMDLGVGSFVYSMGVISARPRDNKTLNKALLSSVNDALPILILGIIRLAMVKGFNYQEHVSEYGVHWNFFTTLGLLPPFVTLLDHFLPSIPLILQSLAIAIGYQSCIEFTPLKNFMLYPTRDNLISKNKEGLCSFIGYLCIFIAGKACGMYIVPATISEKCLFLNRAKSQGKPYSASLSVKYLTFFGTISFAVMYIVMNKFGIHVSRKWANLPYILWIVYFNTFFLDLYIFVEKWLFPITIGENESLPMGLIALNRNGLVMFLVANLLTGIINLRINTFNASNSQALIILIIYTLALFSIAYALRSRRIQLKLSFR